jgi:hypothetical protein
MFISFKSLLSSKHEDLNPLTNLFRTPLIARCETLFAVANLSRTYQAQDENKHVPRTASVSHHRTLAAGEEPGSLEASETVCVSGGVSCAVCRMVKLTLLHRFRLRNSAF